MDNYIIDLHCHSALKPFSKSFPNKKQSGNPKDENSLWYQDKPTTWDKVKNYVATLTNFSQSDFTSLVEGEVRVVCIALYPPEMGFFKPKLFGGEQNIGTIADALLNLVTGLGKERINHLQASQDYFQDLEAEYDFYKQQENTIQNIRGEKCSYQLVKNYQEIEQNINNTKKNTISLVFTIEGSHVFNCGIENRPTNPEEVLKNVQKVKNWEHKPLFVGLAHHFYNELCGHAPSISDSLQRALDQSLGQEKGITNLGEQVIDSLLDNSEGKRIYIDLKHMNAKSRNEYYKILEDKYTGEDIPLIVSHGACNGRESSVNQKISQASEYSSTFFEGDINFYDDEIVRIAKSKGIFGLQLDERRIANKETLRKTPNSLRRKKILEHRSRLLWNQIQHIAQILDRAGLPAWDFIGLGTDFDGIIDTLNGYWTSEELAYLDDNLLRHAKRYFSGQYGGLLTQEFNREIDIEEIIYKVMYGNSQRFLKAYF